MIEEFEPLSLDSAPRSAVDDNTGYTIVAPPQEIELSRSNIQTDFADCEQTISQRTWEDRNLWNLAGDRDGTRPNCQPTVHPLPVH